MTIQKGNALQLRGFGLLIICPSGSGKFILTFLTLALVECGYRIRQKAVLVSDDYVKIENVSRQIFAYTPQQISSVMEILGEGFFEKNSFRCLTGLDW